MADTEEKDWQADQDDDTAAGSSNVQDTFSWTASEYIDHKQGTSWYLLLGLFTLLAVAAVYLLTKDRFAAIIIVTLGIIVGAFAHRTPRQLAYELGSDGLKAGTKFYPYSDFKTFSIIQDGPLTSISLDPLKRFMPPVSAYFDSADQEKVESLLQDHLAFEERQLDGVERLSRRLRF